MSAAKKRSIAAWLDFVFGEEPAAGAIAPWPGWRMVALSLGLIDGLARLLLVHHPAVGYLLAAGNVRDLQTTLPEAMAAARTWALVYLFIAPFLWYAGLAVLARAVAWISRLCRGKGEIAGDFGILTAAAAILLLGRCLGYAVVAGGGLTGLMDLRDLTPGVGLGLLAPFAIERVGCFWWEIIRGFDLFGLWAVVFSYRALAAWNGLRRAETRIMVLASYAIFIIGRWLAEGPLQEVWRVFWTKGSL